MIRGIVLSSAVMFVVALPVAARAQVQEQPVDLFAECRDATNVPDKLKATYAAFAAAARQGKVEAFCLPRAVEITTGARPEKDKEYGQDINLPFLKSEFTAPVFTAAKETADCFLLRTGTSALWFVETKSGEWRLYRYLDKPIQ